MQKNCCYCLSSDCCCYWNWKTNPHRQADPLSAIFSLGSHQGYLVKAPCFSYQLTILNLNDSSFISLPALVIYADELLDELELELLELRLLLELLELLEDNELELLEDKLLLLLLLKLLLLLEDKLLELLEDKLLELLEDSELELLEDKLLELLLLRLLELLELNELELLLLKLLELLLLLLLLELKLELLELETATSSMTPVTPSSILISAEVTVPEVVKTSFVNKVFFVTLTFLSTIAYSFLVSFPLSLKPVLPHVGQTGAKECSGFHVNLLLHTVHEMVFLDIFFFLH